ncbi:MAG: DUF1585 domain-containing protein, partial [Deltaproteobacteria bacterium]|nr:DUF1585 domain-containing protein [Deltaproteobacteria bacterium]
MELSGKIKDSLQAKRCFAKHWFRFAFGRGAQSQDSCLTDALNEVFVDGDGNLKNLLLTIATHETFRVRSPLPDADVAIDMSVDVDDAGTPVQTLDAG